jgi:penicillin-binding protein 1A
MKKAVVTFVVGMLALGVLGFAWLWWAPCWMGGCAPVDRMASYQAEGSELLDIHGDAFGTLATVNRRVVPLDSLAPHLIQAVLAVEDRRFFEHSGVDPVRFGGALGTILRPGRAEGGSTITMQLARNLFPEKLPYTDRSPRRKLREIRVARQIERSFSKEKILELYLNHIYLGAGAYGVEAAALVYFGKPAAELELAEAALIGGLPKAPSLLDPTRNREGATERRNLVLREMANAGFITADEAESAKTEPVRLARHERAGDEPRGSYFIEQVRQEMEEVVGSRFYTAGLKIYTTLDPALQVSAEQELARQLDAIESGRFGSYRHSETYAGSSGVAAETGRTPYLQGAVLVMDARNGEIRAMVGGRDFEDSKFNRALQARRQPGSAYKPFVYLTALETYRSPVHIVEDAPLRLTLAGNQTWEPRNFGDRYDGSMTLRDALTQSKNTATVRLAMDLGMERINRNARTLGISTDLPNNPAVALGAAEVRPIEMAQAYAAFANGGQKVTPHLIRRVEDRNGFVIWEAQPRSQRAIDAEVAYVLTSMMRDVVDRGTGTAVRGVGYTGPAAGKTGTTNDAADVWFVGYTPELVGAVWIGFDDRKTIFRGATGGSLAAPIWGRVMRNAPSGERDWQRPPGVVMAEVERGTGRIVGEQCPANGPTYTEYFVRTRPAGNVCPTREPLIAGIDTLYDGYGAELPAGVDWPELEELRRDRDRLDEDLTALPELSPPPGRAEGERPPQAGEPSPPRERAGERRGQPERQERDTARRPPLLGEPAARQPARPRPQPSEPPAETRPDTAREAPPLLGRPIERPPEVDGPETETGTDG